MSAVDLHLAAEEGPHEEIAVRASLRNGHVFVPEEPIKGPRSPSVKPLGASLRHPAMYPRACNLQAMDHPSEGYELSFQ